MEDYESRSRRRAVEVAAAVCMLCGSVLVYFTTHDNVNSHTTTELVGTAKMPTTTPGLAIPPSFGRNGVEEDLFFEATNEYTSKSQIYDGYPWKFIMEPHRITTLRVSGEKPGLTYRWELDGKTIGEGASIEYTFTTRWYARSHSVVLIESRGTKELRRFETEVICKYVRREIRDLTTRDREAYFNAQAVLQQLDEDEGRAVYGPKYHEKDYFNKKHAGLPGCSAYHKGAQFIGTHMALTLEYEQVLQSIDASVSIPYWDWTRDDAELGGRWRESVVFSDNWFGSAAPDNDHHIIDTGRWAYTPIRTQAWNYSLKTNPYGYMTDAWNMIKKPYLSRSEQIFGVVNTQPLPTCGDHYMCLTLDNWMDFTDCLENYAHENVHQLLGGVTHTEDTLKRLMGRHPEYKKLLLWVASRADRAIMSLHSKQFMSCPEYCALDTPFSECKCACPTLEEQVDRDTLTYLRDELGIFTYLSYRQFTVNYAEEMESTEEVLVSTFNNSDALLSDVVDIDSIQEMLKLYCNPGMIGDQYTSFATNDPVFWPIHPTLERLWHLKRLVGDPAFDETWEEVTGCPGHNVHDIHPFKNLKGETSRHHYSNKDLYDLFDPRNPDLPYLYDNYNWDHCSQDFVSAASSLANAGIYKTFTASAARAARMANETEDLSDTTSVGASQIRITRRN